MTLAFLLIFGLPFSSFFLFVILILSLMLVQQFETLNNRWSYNAYVRRSNGSNGIRLSLKFKLWTLVCVQNPNAALSSPITGRIQSIARLLANRLSTVGTLAKNSNVFLFFIPGVFLRSACWTRSSVRRPFSGSLSDWLSQLFVASLHLFFKVFKL